MWDIAMEDQAEKLEEKYSTPTELTRKAYAFKSEPQIQLVSRYEGRLRPAYERAIDNLNQYRSGRARATVAERPRNPGRTQPVWRAAVSRWCSRSSRRVTYRLNVRISVTL
jgi:hypothetical protein